MTGQQPQLGTFTPCTVRTHTGCFLPPRSNAFSFSAELARLSPETLLRLANSHDFRRRHGHRPPSKLLRKWRRTSDLTLDQ